MVPSVMMFGTTKLPPLCAVSFPSHRGVRVCVASYQLRLVSNSIIDTSYVPVHIRLEYVLCLYMCNYGLVHNYTYALGINSRSAIPCAWPL